VNILLNSLMVKFCHWLVEPPKRGAHLKRYP